MNSMDIKTKKAFTIVELLVAIVVVGIIATITIVGYSNITARTKATNLQSNLTDSAMNLKTYYTQNSSYPTALDSNNCPTAPVADTTNCIKPTAGNSISKYTGTSSTFSLTMYNSNILWKVTENTPPAPAVGYGLTVVAGANGSVSSGGGFYETGTVLTISATANSGYQFSSWTGGTGCAGTASHSLTLTADTTCTANFVLLPVVTLIAGANGSVSGGGSYASGSVITITATPSAGYMFSSWSGGTGCAGTASHSLTVSTDVTCTATFAAIPAGGVWVAGPKDGDGTITDNGGGSWYIAGPNDSSGSGWSYIYKQFGYSGSLAVNFVWYTSDGISYDWPTAFATSSDPSIASNVSGTMAGLKIASSSSQTGTYTVNFTSGQWVVLGVYSNDSCCGNGTVTYSGI